MASIEETGTFPTAPKENERRQATALFADISGFTSMSEKMDPEEVTDIVNDCLGKMGSIIVNNAGTVDKYMGDCAMALFGIPTAIEEAPQKAINAAIEIRNMIEALNQSRNLEPRLSIHIGINTGVVITGGVGKGDKHYTAMGDAVNVASRLKDASKSGQIFVGLTTYNQTKENFEYQELDPVTLKGKEDPVPVYELLSTHEKIYRPKLGAERMIVSDMVGRDEELNILSLHLLKLLNGEGSIVSVTGEAGIGKSRLIAELRRKDEIKQVIFLEGRALSIGKNLSFHPLIDILKNWSGINEEDDERQAIVKLERAINLIDSEESVEILPFIATLMGYSLTGSYANRIEGIEGEALEKLILRNLYVLIEKATAIKPVVLVLEDLHWADLTSIEFFGSLYRLALQNRILFINVFRPGYKNTGEQIINGIENKYLERHQKIELKSLAEDYSSQMINNLLKIKGFPQKIKSLIIKRASGNPFFIEEVVRSFIDEGVVELKNDKFEVKAGINNVIIPETISEVLLARIDRLDEQTKALIKVASVIGRNFFYRILEKVAESIKEMDQKIEYLKEIQLIREQKRKEELEYLFKHALAQEATYESILLKKRKELHHKTAEAIESIFSEKLPEYYGLLATHYSRGENLDKAEEYLLKAGEEALKKSASQEAINYYRDALQLYQNRFGALVDPEKIVMMQKNLAFALRNKGQNTEASRYYDQVLAYYDLSVPLGGFHAKLHFIWGIFHLLVALYLPFLKWKRLSSEKDQETLEMLFQHLNILAFTDPGRAMPGAGVLNRKLTGFDITKMRNGPMMFCANSAGLTWGGASYSLSRKILAFLRDKIDPNNIKEKIYYSLCTRMLDMLQGTWDDHDFDKNLVEDALKIGEVFSASSRIENDFNIDIQRGNFLDAHEKVKWLGKIGQDFDHADCKGDKILWKSSLLLIQRKLHDALSEVELSVEIHKSLYDNLKLFVSYSIKIRIQLLLGYPEEAIKTLQLAEDVKLQDTPPMFHIYFIISQFSLFLYLLEYGKGKHKLSDKEIRVSGKKCLELSKKVALNRTEVLNLTGTSYWLANNQKQALKWWGKSIKEAEKLGAKLELSRTYFEIGKRLLEDKSKYQELDGITAHQYLEKARIMFEEMDLKWDLAQLEKLSV